MARPPQYDRDPYDDPPPVAGVKDQAKRLTEFDRAHLLVWLCTYYQDDGKMFSPQISRRRTRVTIDGTEFWLVRVPKR